MSVGICVNYEDLDYAASRMYEHPSAEYANPVLERFARALLDARRSLKTRSQLSALAKLACEYIVDVVHIELSRTPARLGRQNCVVEAMHDLELESCNIFTLNHDLLIEKVLAGESITAASIPAWRCARADPLRTLRAE